MIRGLMIFQEIMEGGKNDPFLMQLMDNLSACITPDVIPGSPSSNWKIFTGGVLCFLFSSPLIKSSTSQKKKKIVTFVLVF